MNDNSSITQCLGSRNADPAPSPHASRARAKPAGERRGDPHPPPDARRRRHRRPDSGADPSIPGAACRCFRKVSRRRIAVEQKTIPDMDVCPRSQFTVVWRHLPAQPFVGIRSFLALPALVPRRVGKHLTEDAGEPGSVDPSPATCGFLTRCFTRGTLSGNAVSGGVLAWIVHRHGNLRLPAETVPR